MKYKLAKPLPFAEVGAEIHGTRLTQARVTSNYDNTCKVIGGIDQLLADGWIEEIKPRVLYVIYDQLDIPIRVQQERPTITQEDYKVIKVREVTDE